MKSVPGPQGLKAAGRKATRPKPACRLSLSLTPTMETAYTCYSGSSRKLVVALDIGTTFSGAAYALLDPGEVPKIRSVTRQVSPPTSGPSNEW